MAAAPPRPSSEGRPPRNNAKPRRYLTSQDVEFVQDHAGPLADFFHYGVSVERRRAAEPDAEICRPDREKWLKSVGLKSSRLGPVPLDDESDGGDAARRFGASCPRTIHVPGRGVAATRLSATRVPGRGVAASPRNIHVPGRGVFARAPDLPPPQASSSTASSIPTRRSRDGRGRCSTQFIRRRARGGPRGFGDNSFCGYY